MNALVGDQWKISRAQQIRNAMGPEWRSIADALRAQFGEVKQVWLETPALSLGTEPSGEPIGEKSWNGRRCA